MTIKEILEAHGVYSDKLETDLINFVSNNAKKKVSYYYGKVQEDGRIKKITTDIDMAENVDMFLVNDHTIIPDKTSVIVKINPLGNEEVLYTWEEEVKEWVKA